jgi:hypothetical protein
MGANSCSCSTRDQYHTVFSDFFNGMQIKHKTALMYNEKVVEKWERKKLKNCDELVNFLLIEFINNPAHHSMSKIFIKNVLDKFQAYLSELLISLVFLTTRERGAVKVSFKKLLKHYKPEAIVSQTSSPSTTGSLRDSRELLTYNSLYSSNSGENKLIVKRDDLQEILKVYVNFVSLTPIPYISGLARHNDDFIQMMNEEYSEENQIGYINKILDKYGKETISVDLFFDDEYETLCDDSLVRTGLSLVNSTKESLARIKRK